MLGESNLSALIRVFTNEVYWTVRRAALRFVCGTSTGGGIVGLVGFMAVSEELEKFSKLPCR